MLRFRGIILLLILATITLLCACAASPERTAESSNSDLGSAGTARPEKTESVAPLQWNGEGQYYQERVLGTYENVLSVFVGDAGYYMLTIDSYDRSEIFRILDSSNKIIYESIGQSISCAAVCNEGIWLCLSDYSGSEPSNILRLVSLDGNVNKSFSARLSGGYASRLYIPGDRLYLCSRSELACYDLDGNFIQSWNLKESDSVLKGGDGNVYLYEKDSMKVWKIIDGVSEPEYICDLSTQGLRAYGGDDSALFYACGNEGVYAVSFDLEINPVLIWRECSLAIPDIRTFLSLGDNTFLIWNGDTISLLEPGSESEMKVRERLSIATLGISARLRTNVHEFNSFSDKYYIDIDDYTNGGEYSADQAVIRLNTQIMSGNLPDMICFSSISPNAYIAKGYLADLSSFLSKDSDISMGDIAAVNALDSAGGVYYISDVFTLETTVGQFSRFGDRYGYTLSEYLDIESSLPTGTDMLYNMTKETFLRYISSRYIRTAVDWESGSCDFNNHEFIEILNASNRIKENPENLNNMEFGYGPTNVGNGSLVAAMSWVDYVWKLAYEEKMAGCKLSYIGWPTTDGSCGSDIYLYSPIGIVEQGPNREGCWEFVKYMIMNIDADKDYGLPMYLPALMAKIENAKNDEDLPVTMTDEDADRLLELISSVENIAMYDETILQLIEAESGAFFAGDRTAEQTAALIQAKASLYISEQS